MIKIDESSKRNENDKKIKENFRKIFNTSYFLEALFKMKISNYDESLLISGTTCYKTFASKLILKISNVVSSNKEPTIQQLLWASFFYPPLEDKNFV